MSRGAVREPTGELAARRAALTAIRAVEDRDGYANLLLPPLLARSGLGQAERAFATELVYGTLRRRASVERLLARCSTRPLDRIDPAVRDVLRLAGYQLLHTRVPDFAVVDTAVTLVGETAPAARPFANAVLRAAARAAAGPDPLDLAGLSDSRDRLAVAQDHPRWVVDVFAEALAGDEAELEQALAADNDRPEVHLVARPGRISRAALLAEAEAAGLAAEPGRLSPHAVRLAGGEPAALPAVVTGAAGVQDEGSQLCALALHRAAPPGFLVDLCAGPGGKAALLAGLRPRLVALEPRAGRARLVRAAGVRAIARADGRIPPLAPACAAAVLIDAPCSGLGSLRRRPELRWRRQPTDLPALLALQRELLAAAAELLAPGGVLGYVTCSPHPDEADPPLPAGLVRLGARLQLWPHRHGTDALSLLLARRPG